MKLATTWLALALVALGACSKSTKTAQAPSPAPKTAPQQSAGAPTQQPGYFMSARAPSPDPRVGLKAGLTDAGQAWWNMRLVSNTPKPDKFDATNSDLAFIGNYVIQGNYNGYQVWDISNPARPVLKTSFYCPASQSDVSV